MVFGVTNSYTNVTYDIQYVIYRHYYKVVYSIGIHTFPNRLQDFRGARGVGREGRIGGEGRGGDRLGSGPPQKILQSLDRLYKAPKRLCKHINIGQNPKINIGQRLTILDTNPTY